MNCTRTCNAGASCRHSSKKRCGLPQRPLVGAVALGKSVPGRLPVSPRSMTSNPPAPCGQSAGGLRRTGAETQSKPSLRRRHGSQCHCKPPLRPRRQARRNRSGNQWNGAGAETLPALRPGLLDGSCECCRERRAEPVRPGIHFNTDAHSATLGPAGFEFRRFPCDNAVDARVQECQARECQGRGAR